MPRISKPILYTGLLALGVAAYTMMGGDTGSRKSSITAARRGSSSKKAEIYLPEDYKARFARVDGGVKNSFSPLVARASIGGIVGPDVVPADLAGGDPNWVFTGSSVVDGASSALFENRVTLESEFVTQGERWRNCTLVGVGDGTAVLASRSGKKVSLRLADTSAQYAANAPGAPATGGLQPVNPALSGPIGRQIAIRPESGSPAAVRAENGRGSNRGQNVQEQPNEN